MPKPAENDFLIIGHRGAAGLAPENTLPGFKAALDLGCRALELDVHQAAESLLVIHDQDLTRTTNRTGRVADLTLTDLTRIDAGDGAAIPTLGEVFSLARTYASELQPITINIELKGRHTAAPVAEFLAEPRPGIAVLVSSFDHAELAEFRRLQRYIRVAPLFDRWRSDWATTAAALDAWAVNLSTRICTRQRITAVRGAGYRVYVYTVNELRRARTLAKWGASGVFTDRPDRLLNRISE